MESRTRYYSVSEGPQVEVFGNIEGEPTVPIEVHIQGDPLNASQAMVGGDSEGDICREGGEGLPKRKRGRPPGNNKTGSVGGGLLKTRICPMFHRRQYRKNRQGRQNSHVEYAILVLVLLESYVVHAVYGYIMEK